ncbi:HYC_CC_PP family protein [Catalinimonas alkaloidigena]|uniref:HYC_CC_PP family protein n=1 Tax=Catalinimonas alkaloidigena TaxID=1075417 RepID=UPI00115FBC48|nr:hypothetical protein [Catalinimonas alkaloidigena]
MNPFRQLIVLFLALLVLVASTGLVVGTHWCAGELRNLALFGDAAPCPMEQKANEMPPCHQSQEPQKSQDHDCCKTQTLVVDGVDHAVDTKAFHPVADLDLHFVEAFAAVFFPLLAPASDPVAHTLYYSPPLLSRDLPVLGQSFLL